MHGDLQLSTRRKFGDRYPSGKLKQDTAKEQPWARWKRIKDHAVRLGADPDMGTIIGRLSIAGTLTDREASAAIWVADIIGKYERLSGMPRRSAASPSYDRSFGIAAGGADTISDREKKAERAHRAYSRLKAIMDKIEASSWSLLEDMCCNEIEAPSSRYPQLKEMLGRIAEER
jgi:hypothetical protein